MKTKVENMTDMLSKAHKAHYAVGAFSARYTKLIRPIIEAAMIVNSPVIVQLSEKEINRHQISTKMFADEFYRVIDELQPNIPVALHLDHTKTFQVIQEAIKDGFTSVMIDASLECFDENVRQTKEVVAYAHDKGVSVEAELGKIGTTDFVETDTDIELFTVPDEAKSFYELTGVDALAISVGTAHGLYHTKEPHIEYKIVEEINNLIDVPLVLHGGSGVPIDMLEKAIKMDSGGFSKVNIATELEQAMLKVVGEDRHMLESELNEVNPIVLKKAQEAVKKLVLDKMSNFLFSSNQ
jgi:fructose-bisphosphate aldolase class II